ncbi:tryptophan biosynthesis modulator TrpM [Streptomyces sp. NPDC047928]|uniref:tryptophan biosynthesis modulator TrpM n=1 Tax=unclassified Streptomyces TaxID=2593676 RepID=UPI003716195B
MTAARATAPTPHRTPPRPAGASAAATRAYPAVTLAATAATPPEAYAGLARGCRPRGCRAPARRVHGRRVRYVIGDEPGQVNGMRWRARSMRSHHRR